MSHGTTLRMMVGKFGAGLGLGALLMGCAIAAYADDAAAPEPAEVVTVGDTQPPAETASAKDTSQETTPAPESEGTDETRWISGSFEAGFDGYWAKDEHDLSLDQTLRLQMDPPQYPKLHLRGSLWTTEGLSSEDPDYGVLRDIDDGYDSDNRARLLYLYAEIDDVWGNSTLRLGRQRILEGPVFNRIDGAYFSQQRGTWSWYTFVGARASTYTDRHDDLTFGGGVSYIPTPKTRLALDYYYGEEHRLDRYEVPQGPFSKAFGFPYPHRVRGDLNDTSLALSLWQDLTPNAQLFSRLEINDGDAEEFVLDITGFVPKWDLGYQVTYRGRYRDVWDRVNDMTGYYRELGVSEDYNDWLASVQKNITPKWAVSFEAQIHDSNNASRFTGNRDYVRLAAILTATEVVKGVDGTVSLEHWDVRGGESSWTVTGEVTKTWGKLRLTGGADYALYIDEVYDYRAWPNAVSRVAYILIPGVYSSTLNPAVWLLDERWVKTHENIHSLYGRVTWDFAKDQSLSARVEYEQDEGPDSPYWHTQLSYAIQF